MTSVNQGSSTTLLSQWQEYPGGPNTDLVSITITITRVVGGTVVVGSTPTGISHPAVGIYTYTWSVGASQTPGDYLVSWSGVDAQGDTVTATELVTVLGPGEGTFATIRLTTTIKDSTGALVDPATVAVEVLLPSGLVAGPFAGVRDNLGSYHYDYAPTLAGQHVARWVSTMPTGVDEEPFDVAPLWGEADFISLADAKNHLQKTTTADDEQLRPFVSAACRMITDRMGQVSPATMVHDVTQRGSTIVLPTRPVIAVTTVERLPGLDPLPAADEGAGVQGWYLDGSEGVLRHTGCFAGRVRVTYRAGRNPLPPNFRLAALELVAHLWRGSQHNQAGGRPALGETDALSASVRTFAMPFRVMELLGLRKDQEYDMPLVG